MKRCENCNCKIQVKRFVLEKDDYFNLEHPKKFKDIPIAYLCCNCRSGIEYLRGIQRSY
jgi:hypothetical protein